MRMPAHLGILIGGNSLRQRTSMKFMHDTVLRALMAASLAAASLQPAFAAAVAPPKRDGSSGSFDAQFGNGPFGTDEWNLTTGQVYEYIGGGYTPAFTVPFKTITYNGQTVHAFEFSSLTMEPTLKIIVFGSTAVLLSQGNIDIAGQFEFPNGTLGGTPSTGNDGDFNGGSGQVAGGSGGGGGYGQGGYIQTACAGQGFSGGGGTSIYNHTPCEKNPHMADGPNGGDGSGGVVLISAPSITNTGTINFAGGGGSGNDGELVTLDAPIANSGKIIGNR
jgi:hypothetical protein